MVKESRPPLSKTHPNLLPEWDYIRNEDLTPDTVSPNSRIKVWWRCTYVKSHTWLTTVKARTNKHDDGCPFCLGKSFAETCPDLLPEWDKKENGSLDPSQLSPSSRDSVSWICPVNPRHMYKMTISNRAYNRCGCPYCQNKRVLADDNSLAVTHPDMSKEWDLERNGELKPEQVVAGTIRVVHWRCAEVPEHKWQAKVFSRTVLGTGCPYCASKIVDKTNSLATLAPEIAAEWNHELNKLITDKTPDTVSRGSGLRVWWTCKNDPSHEWQSWVHKRTQGKGRCPYCYGPSQTASTTGSNGQINPQVDLSIALPQNP